jgi:trehalose 6-phosphate synthase
VLSRFAGAAGELDGALIVNPYDIYQVARAMDAGLTMPLDERKDRYERMMAKVREHDITSWWSESLRLLGETPPSPGR